MPLFDYFRAPDRESVLRALAASGGHSPVPAPFDGLDAKGVDPAVVLGKVIAAIEQVPWSMELVPQELIFPAQPDGDGPWVIELSASARDSLAGADDAPRVAREWSQIEELGGAISVEDTQAFVAAMIGLAGRAREHNELLYCWCCL
jgi:hypothetical protein